MTATGRDRLLIPVEGPGHTYTLDGRPLVGPMVVSLFLRAIRAAYQYGQIEGRVDD